MEPIIKVDNVSMCFNLSKEKHESLKEYFLAMVQGRLQYDEFYALKDVSLDIMPGDFYGLVGLNGSGKSTLMNILGCLDIPTYGDYILNGTHINDRSDRQLAHIRNKEIGFIFQGYNLIPALTAYENVELPLIYQGVSIFQRSPTASS